MRVYVLGMEKKASFYECPKCGLRNKPTAVQCDFCGQSLNNDDWESHVKDLESLTRVDAINPMEDKVFRRIESTIIRKEAAHNKGEVVNEIGRLEEILKDIDQPKPLNENEDGEQKEHHEVERPEEKVDLTTVIESKEPITIPIEPSRVTEADISEKTIPEGSKNVEKEEISSTEGANPIERSHTPAEETVVVPELPKDAERSGPELMAVKAPVVVEPEITVSTDTSASIIKLKLLQVVEEPKPMNNAPIVQTVHRSWSKPNGSMAILGLGIALYIFVLVLTALRALDTLFGLIGGAIASLITIYGAMVTYHSLRTKDREEVYICPKCHETVDKREDKCPSCGVSFRHEG